MPGMADGPRTEESTMTPEDNPPAPTDPTPPKEPAYAPPASQAELDRIIADRLARERSKFADYNDLKAKAARADELEQQHKSETERAIDAAKEEGRAEVRTVLANERVRSAFDRALAGRVPDTSALLDLDRSQFVKGDSADVDAITAWVNAHSAETVAAPAVPKQIDRSQGVRGSTAGTLDAGRAAYARLHPKPNA